MRDVAQAAMPYAKSSPNPISHLTPNRGIGIINSKKSGDFRRLVWCYAHRHPFLFPYLANWQECKAELAVNFGVEFRAFHRDDQPDSVRNVIKGAYPAVVAQDEAGEFSLFMTSSEISSCGESPSSFLGAITDRLAETQKDPSAQKET